MKIIASFSLVVPALLSGTAYGFGLGMPGQAHALRLPTSAASAASISSSNIRLAMSAVADEVEAKKDTEEAVSSLLLA